MFSAKCNYPKLKTNLRLTVNRLKLLEKKKTELALKSRKEIADYIMAGKEDRARIRVEHIVREDYMVEGMEILEMFCDLLLARFGLIERVSSVEPTIEEAIASIIWAEPRLSADVPELMIISKNLMARYGKEFHAECKVNGLNNVNDKLMRKMSIYSPPKMLIENYMVEIAKSFDVEFQPDHLALLGEDGGMPMGDLLGFGDSKPNSGYPPPGPPPNNHPSGGGGYPPPSGGGGYPPPNSGGGGYPPPNSGGSGYPPPSGGGGSGYPPPSSGGGGGGGGGGFNYPAPSANIPPPQPVFPPANMGAQPPPLPSVPPAGPASSPSPGLPPGGFNIPPEGAYLPPGASGGQPTPPTYVEKPRIDHPPNYSSLDIRNNLSPEPYPPGQSDIPSLPAIPGDDFNLPSVPGSLNPGAAGNQPPDSNDIDFDDLAARFEKLKKRK